MRVPQNQRPISRWIPHRSAQDSLKYLAQLMISVFQTCFIHLSLDFISRCKIRLWGCSSS